MRRIVSWGLIVLAVNAVPVCIAQEEMADGMQENSAPKKARPAAREQIKSSEYKLSEERIRRIEETVQKFYDNHANLQSEETLQEIRSEIGKFVPVKPAAKADTRSLVSIQRSLVDKVDAKFGADQSKLRKQAEKEAEKKYPMAKRNEEVKITYKRGRTFISVSGRFYGFGLGGKSVRLNSRNIPVFDLLPESLALFDPATNAAIRKEYVNNKVREYLRNRQKYSETLFAAEYAKVRSNNERIGYIYQGKSWVTADDVLKSILPDLIRKANIRAEKERLEREAKEKAKRESGQDGQNNEEKNNSDADDE